MTPKSIKGIIVVLGAPNSDTGELSLMALNRLDYALQFYKDNPGNKILCTGGFGEHFNTTQEPHARYAANYLVKRGVPPDDILEYALSRNTIEDALKAKPIVESYHPEKVIVITSDFHMERAALIFRQYFAKDNLIFLSAPSTLDEASLQKAKAHELLAIQKLRNKF